VTTEAYRWFLQSIGIDPETRWLEALQAQDDARIQVLGRCADAIQTAEIPEEIATPIRLAVGGLADKPNVLWAVRSSATTEDAAEASFAGLYKTELGVPTEALLAAVKGCWSSLWEDRVVEYHLRHGLKDTPAMAVVIQPLINARAAGVAFSRHPISRRRDQIVVNAVPGLGNLLVSGEAPADEFQVAVSEGETSLAIVGCRIVQKHYEVRVAPVGIQAEELSEEEGLMPSLSDEDVHTVAKEVRHVEEKFGHPVDVEWALDQCGLWLLQARPITSIPSPGGFTNDESEWSRANFKETLPELPSRLGLNFLEDFMENIFLRDYRQLGCEVPLGVSAVRLYEGRPYINLTLFQSFVAQLGGDPATIHEQIGGEAPHMAVRSTRMPWWKLLRALIIVSWKIRRGAACAPAWFAETRRMETTHQAEQLVNLDPTELLTRLDAVGRRLKQCDLTFGIASGVSQGFQVLQWLLPRLIGEGWRAELNAAIQGQGNVISVIQVSRLQRLADLARDESSVRSFFLAEPWESGKITIQLAGTRFVQAFGEYLSEFGCRAVGESDVGVARFSEDPSYLLGVIRSYVRTPRGESVADIQARQERTRREALARIRRSCGVVRWWMFQVWYRRLCRYLALREANRHHLMFLCMASRQLFLALGARLTQRGQLKTREHIFSLTLEEIRELPRDSTKRGIQIVEARQAERDRHATVSVPDTLRLMDDMGAPADLLADHWRGMPISAGRVEGPVRVIRSAADLQRVEHGDVLVVSVIDPSLAVLFGLAAGLVAEMGGTLSHGAIIAREFGLPAVTNITSATQLLRDGELVEVDATRGLVRRITG
jgi:pyruvate,water dikinase